MSLLHIKYSFSNDMIDLAAIG